jgi:hypothetical protein
LQQVTETFEDLDQVRRRVKKLERQLQIFLLRARVLETELGLEAPKKR